MQSHKMAVIALQTHNTGECPALNRTQKAAHRVCINLYYRKHSFIVGLLTVKRTASLVQSSR
jgi:hypothetical protein